MINYRNIISVVLVLAYAKADKHGQNYESYEYEPYNGMESKEGYAMENLYGSSESRRSDKAKLFENRSSLKMLDQDKIFTPQENFKAFDANNASPNFRAFSVNGMPENKILEKFNEQDNQISGVNFEKDSLQKENDISPESLGNLNKLNSFDQHNKVLCDGNCGSIHPIRPIRPRRSRRSRFARMLNSKYSEVDHFNSAPTSFYPGYYARRQYLQFREGRGRNSYTRNSESEINEGGMSEPDYKGNERTVVTNFIRILTMVPSTMDYNNPSSECKYSNIKYPALVYRDIEAPLKQLSVAGKTGNPDALRYAIKAGLTGLEKGPERVVDFFKVFNGLMVQYKNALIKQLSTGSEEIKNIDTLNRKLTIYIKSFSGNEADFADFIKTLFMYFKKSKQAREGFSETISLVISASGQAGLRQACDRYSPLEISIKRLLKTLTSIHGCQDNNDFDYKGKFIGTIIDSAIKGERDSINDFISIVVDFANNNIDLFRNDVLFLIYSAQSYIEKFSSGLQNVYFALSGDTGRLTNVINHINNKIKKHKAVTIYILKLYKRHYKLTFISIYEVFMRFVSAYFVVLCVFFIPFCCCC
ncbi:hypothetical protein AYI69_g77 [Smittium culicis]|uniref:Uncharacterized protein n=1 Tax=Smittium culicis TaxID=133412 RepID=A0A1R1YU03_9FUNG|nr:hypothetical protein AYI69_g77 [Smittium culicis]